MNWLWGSSKQKRLGCFYLGIIYDKIMDEEVVIVIVTEQNQNINYVLWNRDFVRNNNFHTFISSGDHAICS